MAFSMRSRGGDINVTPLIDVLLVLLVIFLLVIPQAMPFEDVKMPPKAADQTEPQPHLVVRVHADLSVEIVDEDTHVELQAPEMTAGLRAHLRSTHHVVFVELAEELPWAQVVSTIDSIHGVTPSTTQVALTMAE